MDGTAYRLPTPSSEESSDPFLPERGSVCGTTQEPDRSRSHPRQGFSTAPLYFSDGWRLKSRPMGHPGVVTYRLQWFRSVTLQTSVRRGLSFGSSRRGSLLVCQVFEPPLTPTLLVDRLEEWCRDRGSFGSPRVSPQEPVVTIN